MNMEEERGVRKVNWKERGNREGEQEEGDGD